MPVLDTKKLRERAERYFADDARGDLDAAQWGEAMPPGDVLFLLDNYERIVRAARIDRRRLDDGTEPMVGQRVVIVPERAKAWGIPAHTDHVHAACKEFDARPESFMHRAVRHSASDFAVARCPHCSEPAAPGQITCGRVGCREHDARRSA